MHAAGLDTCLALDRNGQACIKRRYVHRVLYFWRSCPITRIFCRLHDEEYRYLLKIYAQARIACRAHRRLLTLQVQQLAECSHVELGDVQKMYRTALHDLDRAFQVRTLRCRRFAAAFDEFANDESVEKLAFHMDHCEAVLRHCMSHRIEPSSSTENFLDYLGSLFIGMHVWRRHGSAAHEMTPLRSTDLAAKYFGIRLSNTTFVRQIQNLAAEPVEYNIRDPLKAQILALRTTFRSKLEKLFVTSPTLLSHLSHERLRGIQTGLYRRLIVEDKFLLANLGSFRSYKITDVLDMKSVTHRDLERLWTTACDSNPCHLRDVLLDLEDGSLSTSISQLSTNPCRINQPLSLKLWKVLYTILEGNLNLPDVYFMCASAEEFFEVITCAMFQREQLALFLTKFSATDDPLLLCMRVFGLCVTYVSHEAGGEVLVGLMQDNATTRAFLKIISGIGSTRICARYSDDSVIHIARNKEDCHACLQPAISYNLEPVEGESMKHLYRRTGRPFSDGVVIQLSFQDQGSHTSTTWRLELVQLLARHSTGKDDVCDALDDVFTQFHNNHVGAGTYARPSQSLLQLKNDYSQMTLDMPERMGSEHDHGMLMGLARPNKGHFKEHFSTDRAASKIKVVDGRR